MFLISYFLSKSHLMLGERTCQTHIYEGKQKGRAKKLLLNSNQTQAQTIKTEKNRASGNVQGYDPAISTKIALFILFGTFHWKSHRLQSKHWKDKISSMNSVFARWYHVLYNRYCSYLFHLPNLKERAKSCFKWNMRQPEHQLVCAHQASYQ